MSMRPLRTGLSGLALALIPLTTGGAHEIVGNRFFPATLTIDDPGVNDELSLPTVDSFKTGDDPPVRTGGDLGNAAREQHGGCFHRPYVLAMISFMISSEPAPIRASRASRQARSTGNSRM